jgi:hypothetical protein
MPSAHELLLNLVRDFTSSPVLAIEEPQESGLLLEIEPLILLGQTCQPLNDDGVN